MINAKEEEPDVPDGAVLSATACVLRWPCGSAGDRLLVLNFGLDITCEPMPEPLLAPPARSLQRYPYWDDTDDCPRDFRAWPFPSPGRLP